jgi:hypothetical protein
MSLGVQAELLMALQRFDVLGQHGPRRLRQMPLAARQIVCSAAWTRPSYLMRRARRGRIRSGGGWLSSWMAYLR